MRFLRFDAIMLSTVAYTWILSVVLPTVSVIVAAINKSVYPLVPYLISAVSVKTLLAILYTPKRQFKYFFETACSYLYMDTTTTVLETDHNLIACFPHGLISIGFGKIGSFSGQNKIKACVSSLILNLPGFGDWLQTIGYTSASKSNMNELMSRGENMMLLAGGFNEIMMMRQFEYNLYVPAGFIAMCIKHNYTIRPAITIGENELFATFTPPKWMWKSLHKLTRIFPIPLIFPYGRWGTLCPFRIPLVPYFGNPIKCYHGDNVLLKREQLIRELHRIFIDNIEKYCDYYNSLGIQPPVSPSQYSIHIYT